MSLHGGIVVNNTDMNAEQVLENWSDMEDDESELSSSEDSDEGSSGDSSGDESSPSAWKEVTGLQ